MANIPLLTHRTPNPRDPGDSIHRCALFQLLGKRQVPWLGAQVGRAPDVQHIPRRKTMRADALMAKLMPRLAGLKSLKGLASGRPLTVTYYRDVGLYRWVQRAASLSLLDAAIVHLSSILLCARQAMALGRPALARAAWAEFLQPIDGEYLLASRDRDEFQRRLSGLSKCAMGAAALGRSACEFICGSGVWAERDARHDPLVAAGARP